MIYCFDLDNTLCVTVDGDYKNSTPIQDRIDRVNKLHSEGNRIIIDTARGSVTGIDWFDLTKSQLDSWGVIYDELRVGIKKYADVYIDDKGISDTVFF
jgi:hypothetical protein